MSYSLELCYNCKQVQFDMMAAKCLLCGSDANYRALLSILARDRANAAIVRDKTDKRLLVRSKVKRR